MTNFHMHRKQYDADVMTAKADDQYFTHPLIAEKCWNVVEGILPQLPEIDYYLEPSAGNGAFLDLLPEDKRIGVDLVKQHPEVIQSDFFNYLPTFYSPLEVLSKTNVLTIGNPPFGKNSNLAIQFFNHAAKFSDTICFVIPRTFRKYSVQKSLDPRFELWFDATLPYHIFFVDGKPWHRIRCCFQIWSIKELEFENQRPDWTDLCLA